MRHRPLPRPGPWLVLAALAAGGAACGRDAPAVAAAAPAAGADSVAALTRRLAAAEQEVRDRDALVGELANTAKLVNGIDSALRRVRGSELRAAPRRTRAAGDPWSARRDTLLARIEAVAQALDASRARVEVLRRHSGALAERLTAYEAAIAELEHTVKRQRADLHAYAAAVDSLRAEGRRLARARDAARDTLAGARDTLRLARDAASRVYFVVGRRRELLARGVVAEEGARRFLVAGRRLLVPGRRVDTTAFVAHDRRRPLLIPLLRAGGRYQVVSRHDPALLAEGHDDDGRPDGALRVSDPARFWGASRFLIVVQE